MTYTLSQIRGWRTSVLTDAADSAEDKTQRFDTLLRGSERDLDRLTSGWRGRASRAADDRVRTEITFGRRLSGTVDTFESAVRRGTNRLWSVRQTLLAKVAAAVADGFAVSDSFTVTDTRTFDWLDIANLFERQLLLNSHADAIGDALTTLATEDKQVAFEIGNALDEVRATTTDVRAGREYAPPASPGALTPAEVSTLVGSPAFRQWMQRHPDAAKAWLDSAVDGGLLAPLDATYKTFLQQYWQQQAFESAGIDPTTWDPSLGADANSATITKVYEYYGQLYLDHPELAWAGMANLIGPSFAGGFYDLDMLRNIAERVEDGSERIPDLPGGADDEMRRLLDTVAGMSGDELGFYESTLLGMQKEIFQDQAAMHEAYLLGGPRETDRMTDSRIMDEATGEAWRNIASGEPDLVEAGNDQLLHREQWDIIADDYDTMRNHPVTGEAVTWLTTVVGAPSIPDAQGYADVFPEVLDLGSTPNNIGPISVRSSRRCRTATSPTPLTAGT